MSSVTMSTPWTDGKRWLWLLSPALPLLAVIGLYLFHSTGFGLYAWSGPIILYGLIPVLDWLIGMDPTNPPESAVAGLEDDKYYRVIVYLYIPFQYGLTAYGAWLVATAHPSVLETVGLIFTVGTINGIAINTAHELGHKKGDFERWLAKLTLAPVAYGHF